jgi:anti-anti-sigma factor
MTVTIEAPTDLVVGTREELRRQIRVLLAQGHDVVLDLRRCGYVDSASIGMLLRTSREARELGRHLQLAGVSGECGEYFDRAQLLGKLELVPFPVPLP